MQSGYVRHGFVRHGYVRLGLTAIVLSIAISSTDRPDAFALEWTFVSPDNQCRVQFDTGSVVSCRDITTAEFSDDHPGDRLLEATIEISTLRQATGNSDVEYLVQIFSPDRHIQVTDYSPRTAVQSGIAGAVEIETTNQGNASIGVDAGGIFDHIANISGHATAGGSTTHTERYTQTPDHQVVLASGLMQRGTGVYFKVRTSPTTAVEGGRRFSFQFRASELWRGERWHVYCQGFEQIENSDLSTRTGKVIGRGQFVVAAFLAGDRTAKRRADEYANAEFRMRRAASQYVQATEKPRSSSILHRVGISFDRSEPNLPRHWPNQLMFGNPYQVERLIERLPVELRPFVDRWQDSRDNLDSMARPEDVSADSSSG